LGKDRQVFRLFYTDFVVTFFVIVATLILWNRAKSDDVCQLLYQLFVLLPLVLWGHFFLFCNVFRVSRGWELVWGYGFAAVYGYSGLLFVGKQYLVLDKQYFVDIWSLWYYCLLIISPLTLAVILITIFKKDYHGVVYRLIPWGRKIKNDDE